MEHIVEQNLLYDFYGELLTEHQRRVYESAVHEDLSLKELSDEYGITRQGVHDLIKRCDKILKGYEDRLHMIERFDKVKKLVGEIDALALDGGPGNRETIHRLCSELMEAL
ncbi:MAG: DNA-binding protein [Lachnospiraceae bacterium]|nr:DNA-binding protein [Lachnospiraceae bacterium]MBR6485119.1 DNA-binding protein [Lachnospiraceae bacterium]